MCGFAGFISRRAPDGASLEHAVAAMTTPISHRGPDDSGSWSDADHGVALGFRRLAILELSELGHQPMHSASGRFVITFNGELYNYRALRDELRADGFGFRGGSDTEVILAAFEKWGLEAPRRFVGMFAIALWDRREKSLTLVRDQLGVKPVFIYHEPGYLSFGSELKALLAGPRFDRTVDRVALAQYLRFLYVPGPRTIFAHARKLPPGHLITIRDPEAPLPASQPYWSATEAARAGIGAPFEGSATEAVDELERRLGEAVRLQLQSDVPLGALLSGGIDSSTVVALAQRASSRPLRTFSIAFDDARYNEADHARRIAEHLGTDHTELMLTGQDALDAVPRLAEIFDEPHADTSQLPAYLVCALARKHVTVALSGDGGDEVFGGYNRYTYGEQLLTRALRIPAMARRAVGTGIEAIPASSWEAAHRLLTPVLPARMRQKHAGEKIHKIGRLMGAATVPHMYRTLVSAWQRPEEIVRDAPATDGAFEEVLGRREPRRLLDRMMLADQLTYLADDQLAKVDRVSMAVSLEVRVPLLDHRVVEFAWRLPATMKIRDGKGKWPLRQVLYRLVPEELVERPKMGLSVPTASWLRGPLRGWAEELLDERRLADGGLLNAAPIRRSWARLKEGHDGPALALWSVLMLQAWREQWA